MNNVYLLSFDAAKVHLETLINFLDRHKMIETWRYPAVVGSVFIVSSAPLIEVQGIIQGHMQGHHFFLVPINSQNIGGYADQETWRFIQFPPIKADSLPTQLPPAPPLIKN